MVLANPTIQPCKEAKPVHRPATKVASVQAQSGFGGLRKPLPTIPMGYSQVPGNLPEISQPGSSSQPPTFRPTNIQKAVIFGKTETRLYTLDGY